ncbi:hypothetical protein OG723_43495 (plasmid) [Streptomyces sp. NBC_01278]|uniref:hypothetical protein n=1 Tax=Streptomyces sp. NBC_01278 TaxID=2903809 RepID=UPI002E345FAD|nr:hypothetical protein [Streptomyces sp. NBC_01278]
MIKRSPSGPVLIRRSWPSFHPLPTAFFTHSTARRQVKAEALRTLRESRRATYTSFAETSGRYLEMLATTLTPLENVERFPEEREQWIEDAHKRWSKALRHRQNEVEGQRLCLALDATRPVADAAQDLAKNFALLSYATRRAIAAHKGHDLDTGPIEPPLPSYIALLTEGGLEPEAPDLKVLQSRARDAYNAFLSAAASDLGENGVLA